MTKLIVTIFLFSLVSIDAISQLTAVNDYLTGCKSVFSSERLNILMNDTDSRNEVELDSADYVYPVFSSAFIDSIRNVTGGSVQKDSINRQLLIVRWTDGITLVDSLTFEYRFRDTVGTNSVSNWAMVSLTRKKTMAAMAGSYTNSTKTVINGCRSLTRGRTVFESGSKYEVKMTNSSFFGPGTEIKAGSVVLIKPE